jgi:nucleotide-binding universal stress UspA family protein
MKTPVKLLVGLHLDATTEAGLDLATALAPRLDAEIMLGHVLQHVPYELGSDYIPKRDLEHYVNLHLSKRCEALKKQGLNATPVPVCFGPPHKTLLEYAAADGATALVIGAEKKTLRKHVLGATAERLVQRSPLPVFLRHPKDPEDALGSLLCAIDFSDHSRQVLANAVDLARCLKAQLHVLHVEQHLIVFEDLADLPSYQVHMSAPGTSAAAQLDAFIAGVNTAGVTVTLHIAFGSPEKEIVDTVKALKPGMLVIGRHGHGGFVEQLVGSVTTRILRSLPCSMLVIGDEDL